jgi:hypothetical protein
MQFLLVAPVQESYLRVTRTVSGATLILLGMPPSECWEKQVVS